MVLIFVLVLYLAACHVESEAGSLPSYMTPCDFNSKDLDACIKKEIQSSIPIFSKGIPDLNIDPTDPTHLDDINIDQNNLRVKFTDCKLYGLSKINVIKVHVDTSNPKDIAFTLNFKGDIKLMAKYNASGQVLILPVTGNGPASITAHNAELDLNSKVKISHNKENNEYFMKLIDPHYNYSIEYMKFDLKNLFNGNKELSDTVLNLINENWKVLMEEFASPIIAQMKSTIVKILNKFFSKVSVDKLFKNYPLPLGGNKK